MSDITRTTPFDDLPELLTVEEFGDYLGLSRNGSYECVRSGAVECVRFGRMIRIPKRALDPRRPESRNLANRQVDPADCGVDVPTLHRSIEARKH